MVTGGALRRGALARDQRVRERDAEAVLGAGEPVVLAVVAVAAGRLRDDVAVVVLRAAPFDVPEPGVAQAA